jgi:hypothetical protein
MKKKLIIFSLLSVLILILIPSINAVEYNLINNNNKSIIKNLIIDESNSLEKYINLLNNDLNIKIDEIISSPQCFAIPYAILTFILLCLIFGIIGIFGTTIAFIMNIIIGMIASVFGAFFGIISLIYKIVVAIMNGTVSTISEIINIISTFTAIFINIIKQKFVNIKAFIILLIGLTIDILKIIYDTLFPNPNICIN